jgi:hypothetical protein
MVLLETDALSRIIKKNPLSEPDLRIASIPLINRLTNESISLYFEYRLKGKGLGR